MNGCCGNNNYGISGAAFILVLFILLVIIVVSIILILLGLRTSSGEMATLGKKSKLFLIIF